MRPARRIGSAAACSALVLLLALAPAALAASAVDQYSEGIPTASGQKPTRDAAKPGGGGTATIAPATRAQLEKTKQGAAAARAARITAPGRSAPGSADAGDAGMGLLLPLILVAALAAAVGILFARRRAGPSSA
jgi:hypothetical protein